MFRRLLATFLAITLIAIPSFTTATVSAAPFEGNPALSRAIGPEGMVLLKNEPAADGQQALPLRPSDTVSVFGGNQINTIKGGTGSGDVNVSYTVNILQGIRNRSNENKVGLDSATSALYQANTGYVATDADVAAARAVSNKAIIVIGRNSGEGGDRGSGAGDYQLSAAETTLIQRVTAGFSDVIVVLNIGGMMDLSWVKNYPQIKSVLLGWQAGMEGGNAIADVLVGDAYPSGKLVDTFAENYDYYPSSSASGIGTFGGNYDVLYGEDIYVGYRYFATADPTYSRVTYEFGYGLGYADMALTPEYYGAAPDFGQVPVTDGNIVVAASVKNNSAAYSGKEVVQVYYQGPDGELNKAARELAAFKKTDELKPSEETTVSLSFPVSDMASYDDLGKTGNQACWVLEPGRYKIYVGNSVKNAVYVGYHDVAALTVTETAHTYLTPTTSFDILVDPVTGETEPAGPPAPIPSYTLAADSVVNINAYEPSAKSAGIVYITGSSAGNPSVTGFNAGTWLTYNVTVEQAGDYYFSFSYSNGSPAIADSFSVFLDDGTTPLNTEPITMAQTSTSSMYQPMDSAKYIISLPAGEHVIKLAANAALNGYLNFLTFQPIWLEQGVYTISALNHSRITVADYYDAVFTGNTTFELIPDGSGDRCLGSFNSGSSVTYKVNVEETGAYDVILDYANGNGAMTDQIGLFFDDNNPAATRLTTNPAAIAIDQTASSGTMRYYTFVDSAPYTVNLTEGTHFFTVRVTGNTGSAGNLRSISFRPVYSVRNDRSTLINAYAFSTKSANIRLETVPATGLPTVAYFNSGEVLTYKLNVETAGKYKFQLNYSNGRAAIANPFTISVNGVAQDVQVLMEQTGNGDGEGAWYNPRLSDAYLIDLPQGDVTLTLTALTSCGNLNFFTLRPDTLPDGYYNISAFGTARVWVHPPTSATFTGNAVFESVPATAEMCIGNFDTGTRLNYTLNTGVADTYNIVFDYANGNTDRTNAIDVLVNDVNTGLVVNFPRIVASGWYDFGDSAVYQITLPEGVSTLSLVSKTTSAGNIRSIRISRARNIATITLDPNSDMLIPLIVKLPTETPDVGMMSAAVSAVQQGYSYDPADYVPKYETDPDHSIFKPNVEDGPKLIDLIDDNGNFSETELAAFVELLTVDEMAYLSGGHGAGIPSGTGTLGGLARLSVPPLETADGPAGLRIDSATAWPIGTMLACTWNEPLIERMGEAVGDEMVLNRVDIWLAPGMNIHRNPLCGRNFEYYSEDPLLTGKIAAALTRGVQSRDVGVTLKHYAFNNQEQARNSTGNSVMTERAAREIYLKGFEIALKEANPFCIMSSYNLMNGVETSERWDLITGIPTGEWGWRGIMMTDWGNGSDNAREAAAGNDIKMSSGSVSSITSAVTAGTLTVEQLRENMTDILITTLRSRKLFVENEIVVTPVPAAGRIRMRAADFNEVAASPSTGQAPQAEGTSDVGGGRNLGYMDTGGSVTYYIDVARSGVYKFTFRYAGNSGSGGILDIVDNGVSTGARAQFTNTGGWQNWATLETPVQVPLAAGEHKLTFNIINGGCNLNWFDVERVLTPDLSIDPEVHIYQSAASVTEGQYSPEFAIIRDSGESAVTLYAAAYNADGKLLAVDANEIAVSTNYIMAVAGLDIPDAEGVSYKFFLWDGDFKPLTAITAVE